jgi:hypothetical protein
MRRREKGLGVSVCKGRDGNGGGDVGYRKKIFLGQVEAKSIRSVHRE